MFVESAKQPAIVKKMEMGVDHPALAALVESLKAHVTEGDHHEVAVGVPVLGIEDLPPGNRIVSAMITELPNATGSSVRIHIQK